MDIAAGDGTAGKDLPGRERKLRRDEMADLAGEHGEAAFATASGPAISGNRKTAVLKSVDKTGVAGLDSCLAIDIDLPFADCARSR